MMFVRFCKLAYQKILAPACAFFTLFVFITALISSFGDISTPAITVSKILVILLFSILLSVLNLIFHAKSLTVYLRIGIHYFSSLVCFFLVMILLSGDYAKNGMPHAVIMLALYTIGYLLVVGCYFVGRAIMNKKREW